MKLNAAPQSEIKPIRAKQKYRTGEVRSYMRRYWKSRESLISAVEVV